MPEEARPEGGKDAYTRDRMQKIARLVDEEIPAGWGFFVMVFPFHNAEGRMNYCSNGQRETIHELMREFIKKGGATFEHR
jgi:hypothetical protein